MNPHDTDVFKDTDAPFNLPMPDKTLSDGDTIGPFTVIATPGHPLGSVCFYASADNTIFAGDTVFREGIGRTDFPESDDKALRESLTDLAKLPDDIKVYPGHGPTTILGAEKSWWGL
jgi:glyoxylase-like metal-dependent hydrolase (beta-lactamase superfamily II)